jgi:hypothetical protein
MEKYPVILQMEDGQGRLKCGKCNQYLDERLPEMTKLEQITLTIKGREIFKKEGKIDSWGKIVDKFTNAVDKNIEEHYKTCK